MSQPFSWKLSQPCQSAVNLEKISNMSYPHKLIDIIHRISAIIHENGHMVLYSPRWGHMIPTEEKKNTKTLSLWPTDDLLLQSPTGQNFWKLDHFWPAFPANRPGFLDKIGMWFWCSPVCNFQLPTSNQQKRSTRKKMMWSFIWTAPGSRGWPCLLSPLAASTSLRQ